MSIKRFVRSCAGVSTIEFALVLPACLLIVFMAGSGGLYWVKRQALVTSVNQVASLIQRDPLGSSDTDKTIYPYAPWFYKAHRMTTGYIAAGTSGAANFTCGFVGAMDATNTTIPTYPITYNAAGVLQYHCYGNNQSAWYIPDPSYGSLKNVDCDTTSCRFQFTIWAHIQDTGIPDIFNWGLTHIDVLQSFWVNGTAPTTGTPTGFQHIQLFTHSSNVHYTAPSCTGAPAVQLVGTHCIAPNGSDVTASNYNAGGNSTSNGSFAVPDGITVVKASIIAGGGGGGGGAGGESNFPKDNGFNGGGGGSGGMIVTYILNPASSISYYVGTGGDSGAGGSAGSSCGNTGQNGKKGEDSYITSNSTTYTAPAGYGGGGGTCSYLSGDRGFGGGSDPSSYTIGTASNLDANSISLPGRFGGQGTWGQQGPGGQTAWGGSGGPGGTGWFGGGGTAGYGLIGQDHAGNYNGSPGGDPGSGYGGGGGGGGGGQGNNGSGAGHGEAGGGGSEGLIIFEY